MADAPTDAELIEAYDATYNRMRTFDRHVHALRAVVEKFTPSPPVAAPPATPVAPTGWQPLKTAPDGQRVLLGPRYAPVVGIVRKMPFWADEQEPAAAVIHYNGSVLVAGYHCSEWHPLPDGATAQPQPQPAQPLTADQRQDLLAAAFYIACRNEPGATLKDVDAERIADLLTELSGFELARITAPSTPTPEVAP